MAKKPLEIDMIAGSQLKDTQGEMLSVEGADISELESGNGRLNDNHGKGFFNSIGRVTKAHKVFKEEDCLDDRERYYWDKIKAPFIYVKGLLYDDEDHPNAKAAAAILRNIHKADIPLKLKASVEGGVISRGLKDPSLLARTKIHSVALTFTPANNATLVEPTSLDKSIADFESDMRLIKSVEHLAQTNIPSFRHIVRDAKAQQVYENLCLISDMLREEGISLSNIPSKEEILRKALEAKIKNNVSKIHSLVCDLDPLKKSAALKLPASDQPAPHVRNLMGQTHNVEVHPDMDHLYNVKGMIKDSGKTSLPISHIKKQGVSSKIVDQLPRDAKGNVTPEGIDKHIASLPKHKVQINVVPYTMQSQQHRSGQQYTASVGLHPDTLNGMTKKQQAVWHEHLKGAQHNLEGHKNQIGWARIDPSSKNGNDHWHMDEIQSDFQNKDKLGKKLEQVPVQDEHGNDIPMDEDYDYKETPTGLNDKEVDQMHKVLSHGHDDPQHMIHSAVNALARKNNVKSMSMDTPEDQAKQSMLRQYESDDDEITDERNAHLEGQINDYMRNDFRHDTVRGEIDASPNKYLQSAYNKVPHQDLHDRLADAFYGSEPAEGMRDQLDGGVDGPVTGWDRLSDPEKDALTEYMRGHADRGPNWQRSEQAIRNQPQDEDGKEREKAELPVHQMDTYRKRPKKLGMKEAPKADVIGEDPEGRDKAEKVQYMKLHKKIHEARMKANILKMRVAIDDEMNKGIKGALAAGAMAAGIATAPAAAQPPRAPTSVEHIQQKANPILDAISQVESSGGKNLNHKTMQHGIHAGMTAGGKYAMMPLSAQYTLKNDPALAKKYPELVESAKDLKGHHKDFTDRFNKDPQVAEDFAQSFYKRTKSKTKSPEMLIHAWNHGLKGTWDKYKRDPDSIKNDEYVKAVQDAMQRLHKGLSAGYGGAGAPMGRTGGAVIQTESIDDGRKGMKYVSCDKCGKEAVYMKHQVKCRTCGDNFSLKKLYEVMGKHEKL